MRNSPEADATREASLSALVREAVGPPFRLLDDGPDIASLVLASVWNTPGRDEDLERHVRAFCAVMAMGTDAFRAARSALLIGDFGGVFLQLRRADEMQTLAACFGLVPGEADHWLAGGDVRQRELRRRIEAANPQLAAVFGTSYNLMSNEAHGRAQSLAVYENRLGSFDWPPDADTVDGGRIRTLFVVTLSVLMAHFGTLRWMFRDWQNFDAGLAAATTAYYDALVSFALGHQQYGVWQAMAPGYPPIG